MAAMIAAVSSAVAPPRISGSVVTELNQFDEGATDRLGVDEGNPMPTSADAGLVIDERGAGLLEVAKCGRKVGHRISHMVKALAASRQEATYR